MVKMDITTATPFSAPNPNNPPTIYDGPNKQHAHVEKSPTELTVVDGGILVLTGTVAKGRGVYGGWE
jgi:hypothetical protein